MVLLVPDTQISGTHPITNSTHTPDLLLTNDVLDARNDILDEALEINEVDQVESPKR